MHRVEMETLFLIAKSFNINLVKFLPPYHAIISNEYVCSFMCTIFHMDRRAAEMVLHDQNLMYENL